MIESLDLEKHFLAGLLKHPDAWAEVSRFVTSDDFANTIHKTIFTVIKNTLNANETLDSTVVAQKVKDLNITFENSISIFDYVDALKLHQISEEGLLKTTTELNNITVRRSIWQTCQSIQREMVRASDKSLSEIISIPQKMLNKQVNMHDLDNEPIDLFDGTEEYIEELGNAPEEEAGLVPPYPKFKALFGGFTPGDLYIFAAPKKQGKSTLLLDIMIKTCNIFNENVRGLILDTELETKRQKLRMASSLSGVPEWYIKTGNWKKNIQMVEALREKAFPILREYKKSVDHIYVGGKPIDEVCSIIRRWYKKNIDHEAGQKAVICYDYLKLTGEKVSESWKEYQVIGEKTDKLKQVATEIGAPVIAACQTNEEGKVALSARMAWFASFVAYFQKKTVEELAEYGLNSGSHMLIPYVSRNQGKDGKGFNDLVKVVKKNETKFVPNFINFDVQNFHVTELNTLEDLLGGVQLNLDNDKDDDERLL